LPPSVIIDTIPKEEPVRKVLIAASLVAAVSLTACSKTGDGEYKVSTPDVDVSTDTTTVRTPTVETGVKTDTMIVKTPTVDVKTPAERAKTP
jgi:hypothetical protein